MRPPSPARRGVTVRVGVVSGRARRPDAGPATRHFRFLLTWPARRTGPPPHWLDHSHDCPERIRRAGHHPPLTGPQSAGPQRDALRKSAKHAARGRDPAAATRSSKRKSVDPDRAPDEPRAQIFWAQQSKKRGGRHEKSTLGDHMSRFPLQRGRHITRPAPQSFRNEN